MCTLHTAVRENYHQDTIFLYNWYDIRNYGIVNFDILYHFFEVDIIVAKLLQSNSNIKYIWWVSLWPKNFILLLTEKFLGFLLIFFIVYTYLNLGLQLIKLKGLVARNKLVSSIIILPKTSKQLKLHNCWSTLMANKFFEARHTL